MEDVIIAQLNHFIDEFESSKSKEEKYDALENMEVCIEELKEILCDSI